MKKVPFLSTLVLALFWLAAIAQAQTPQQMAAWLTSDNWVADLKSMEVALKEKFKAAEAQQLTRAQREELQRKKSEAYQALFVFQQVQMQFNRNGSYNLRVQNTDVQQGVWQVAADGKSVIFDGTPTPFIKLTDTHFAYPIDEFMSLYLVAEKRKGEFLLEENEHMAIPLMMAGSYPKSRMKIVPAPDGKTFTVYTYTTTLQELYYCECRVEGVREGIETGACKGQRLTHYETPDYMEGSAIGFYGRDPNTGIYMFGHYVRPITPFIGNEIYLNYLTAPADSMIDEIVPVIGTKDEPAALTNMATKLRKWWWIK